MPARPLDAPYPLDKPPYPPSWVDHVLWAVQRNRIPNLAFYLGLFVIGHAAAAALWMSEGKGFFEALFTPPPVFLIWDIYLLALMQYLNAVARDKVRELRPALGVDDETFAVLAYRLTVMPARETLVSGLFWVAVSVWMFWMLLPVIQSLRYANWEIGLTIATYFVGGAAIYHTFHQLRSVSELHGQVKEVDLFDLDPLYTMSGLTARTGAGLVILVYITYLILPHALTESAFGGTLTVVLAMAIAAFLVPLTGIQRRLEAEKKQAVDEVNQRLKHHLGEINRRIDEGRLDELDPFNKAVGSLLTERDILNKISTWPWQAATLRAFISALVLPVILKYGQDLLEQMMSLLK